MDPFKYIEVHKNEESPFKVLSELLNELNKTNPEIVEGMAELVRSGLLKKPEFIEKSREMWRAWVDEVNDTEI